MSCKRDPFHYSQRLYCCAGLSVSALSRSVITVEPEGKEADALRQWWESEGHCITATPAGEGLMSALKYVAH